MKIYIAFVKNAFYSNTAYRVNTYLSIFQRVITLFIQISIWTALFGTIGYTKTRYGMITLREMITYTIVSTCISVLMTNNVINRIDSKIRTGEIAMDLIKPFNFRALLFCEMMGNTIYRIFFQLIPIIIFGALIWGISVTSWQLGILVVVSSLNGMFIYFLISYILGIIGFWYLSVWHLDRLLSDLVRLLSGAFIPLWFFPEILNEISQYLPFRLIYFTPISIYLNRLSMPEAINLILQQFLWIIALFAIQKFLWSKGIKKLVLQGG